MKSARAKQQAAYRRARTAAFLARGLRSDGKPRAPRKPCGCLTGRCLRCMRPSDRAYVSPEQLAQMWADYQSGLSLSAVARKYGRHIKSQAEIFKRRGLVLRHTHRKRPPFDPTTGRILPYRKHTDAEIDAAIAPLKYVSVPPELRQEWRHRPMAWRVALIRRIRRHLYGPSGWAKHMRPRRPFSPNVKPFEYGTPAAHRLVAQINAGRDSRHKLCHMRPSCHGVIWADKLWFWTARRSDGAATCYVSAGKWHGGCPSTGKVLLHHAIWEDAHGQKVPEKHIISFRDGNFNNLRPANLVLMSKADNVRRNAWHRPGRLPRDRRQKIIATITRKRAAQRAAQSRARVAALLQASQQPSGLLAALQRRNEP